MSNPASDNLNAFRSLESGLEDLDATELDVQVRSALAGDMNEVGRAADGAGLPDCARCCFLFSRLIDLSIEMHDEDPVQAGHIIDFVRAGSPLVLMSIENPAAGTSHIEPLMFAASEQWGDYLELFGPEEAGDEFADYGDFDSRDEVYTAELEAGDVDGWDPDANHINALLGAIGGMADVDPDEEEEVHSDGVSGEDEISGNQVEATPSVGGNDRAQGQGSNREAMESCETTESDETLELVSDDDSGEQSDGLFAARPSSVPDASSAVDFEMEMDAELLEAYLDDTSRCLGTMEQTVLAIEEFPGNRQLLTEFCRDLHTLKGASATVGLEKLAAYLHRVESTIDDNSFTADDDENLELLLNSIDTVRKQISALSGTVESNKAEASSNETPARQEWNGKPELRVTDDSSIRIRASKLDRMMDMLAELVVLRNRRETHLNEFHTAIRELTLCASRLRFADESPDSTEPDSFNLLSGSNTWSEVARDITEVARDLNRMIKPVAQDSRAISTFIRQFRQEFMQLRRLPVAGLFSRLQRAARDAAKTESKQVKVRLVGAETGLDQEVQERLYEPLLHIVRNAVSHGIEADRKSAGKPDTGELIVEARSSSNLLIIEIRDDGAGLDYDAVRRKAFESGLLSAQYTANNRELAQLIFHPGFSTRREAGQVSGRGMGMDIVASAVNKLQGRIEVDSVTGHGTTIRLSVPLRTGIEHVMVFRVGGQLFAIPMTSITGVRSSEKLKQGFRTVSLAAAIGLDGCAEVERDVLLFNQRSATGRHGNATGDKFALTVSEVLGPEEVVVRPLPAVLQRHPLFAGVVLAGSGESVLLIETEDMLQKCSKYFAETSVEAPASKVDGQSGMTALVVDDSISARKCIVKIVKQLGFDTKEASNGLEAIENLQTDTFDLIFTDLDMPVLGGLEFLAELQRINYCSAPVVVVSSRDDDDFRERARSRGAAGYIVKPAREPAVVDVLSRLQLLPSLVTG
ncbi:MAG: response regulator [Planctomycetota bacterium]